MEGVVCLFVMWLVSGGGGGGGDMDWLDVSL